jgi:hypothetical protein
MNPTLDLNSREEMLSRAEFEKLNQDPVNQLKNVDPERGMRNDPNLMMESEEREEGKRRMSHAKTLL